jgi:hypothetical protein
MRQAPPPLTEQQHLDVAVSVGAVLGHLGGRDRDRDAAEHMDLGAQDFLVEHAQCRLRQRLHARDEGRHGLRLRRPRRRIERRVGIEVGREGLPVA